MSETIIRSSKELGTQIKAARQLAGLSQSDLADISGCDQRQISRIETASHESNLTLLLQVIAALDLDLAIVERHGGKRQPRQNRPEDIF